MLGSLESRVRVVAVNTSFVELRDELVGLAARVRRVADRASACGTTWRVAGQSVPAVAALTAEETVALRLQQLEADFLTEAADDWADDHPGVDLETSADWAAEKAAADKATAEVVSGRQRKRKRKQTMHYRPPVQHVKPKRLKVAASTNIERTKSRCSRGPRPPVHTQP